MFRGAATALGKGVASGCAAAAAATPKPTSCREAQPGGRWSQKFGKEEAVGTKVTATAQPLCEPINGDWLLTQLNDNNVVFDPEEINEVASTVLALPFGNQSSGTRIREVDVNGVELDTDSESNASDVNEYMQTADSAINASRQFHQKFDATLLTLLHDSRVQRACMEALADDANFMLLLQNVDQAGPVDIPIGSFLPPAAQAAGKSGTAGGTGEGEGRHPFAAVVESLAASLRAVGENLAGLRDALGGFFIDLGNRIHALLGQPFGATPLQEASIGQSPRQEAVGNMLITVACAILALVLVKRIHCVRFV